MCSWILNWILRCCCCCCPEDEKIQKVEEYKEETEKPKDKRK